MEAYDQHHELVRRCLQGERKAQFSLYQAYAKAMYNICHRMMGNRSEAEDVLQNAFVDVFTKLNSFRFESSVGAWIKRIVINQCINALKKRKLTWVELNDQTMEVEDEVAKPGLDHGDIDRIRRCIDLLPDGYRVVFSLYLLEGYDHQEISTILGISEGASKSQYSRAKKKIYQLLEEKTKAG